jgi:hypothetical protein
MSNGQQLEMVDGSLIEIRPASLQVSHALYSTSCGPFPLPTAGDYGGND